MRVAGVRIEDGRMVWVDAAELGPVVRDRVSIRTPDGVMEGAVLVIPEQWLSAPVEIGGEILNILLGQSSCGRDESLPGSDLPPLGSMWNRDGVQGVVTGIDPVTRVVTVTLEAGGAVTFELPPIPPE